MVKISSKTVMIQTGKEIDRIIKTNIILISELDIWRYMEGLQLYANNNKIILFIKKFKFVNDHM